MSLRIVWTVGGLGLLLSACASPQGGPPPVGVAVSSATAQFRPADFGWSKVAGNGRIDGHLVYSSRGAAYGCVGSAVVLTPETPWVRSRMKILYRSADSAALPAAEVRGRTPPERSQDYSSFVRRTTCDATNKFSFSGLPDGAWFVITVAKSVTAGAGPDMAIMRRVTVRNGGVATARL